MKEGEIKACQCLKIMNELVGFDVRDNDRRSERVWARNLLAYKMKDYGLTLGEIGEILCRDHATVSHCQKRAKTAIDRPLMYQDVMEIWNSFQERLNLEKL